MLKQGGTYYGNTIFWFAEEELDHNHLLNLINDHFFYSESNRRYHAEEEGVESSNQEQSSPAASAEPFEYPMEGLPELTLMTEFPDMGTPNQGLIDDEYEKRTGIAIRHLGGVPMQDNKFKYLLASGNMPDIFMNNWLQFPGGPEKAIEQGYILPLNDVIDRYAPNFKRMLEENPEIDKMVKTDSGIYYAFPLYARKRGRYTAGQSFARIGLTSWGSLFLLRSTNGT